MKKLKMIAVANAGTVARTPADNADGTLFLKFNMLFICVPEENSMMLFNCGDRFDVGQQESKKRPSQS